MMPVKPIQAATTAKADDLRFDYSQIEETNRTAVRGAAVEIKAHANRAKESMLRIGQRLAGVKALLPHGQFEDWCKVEFEMSDRTAQRMMAAAEVFGSKTDTVSVLSDTAMYLLSGDSVPEAAREEVIVLAQQTGKSPTKAQVQATIISHKHPPPAATRPLTLDETLAVIWRVLRNSAGHEQDSGRLAWLQTHGDQGNYKQALNPGVVFDGWTFAKAIESVSAELQGNINRAERKAATGAAVTTPRVAQTVTVTTYEPTIGDLDGLELTFRELKSQLTDACNFSIAINGGEFQIGCSTAGDRPRFATGKAPTLAEAWQKLKAKLEAP